jgi:hypothetical protein
LEALDLASVEVSLAHPEDSVDHLDSLAVAALLEVDPVCSSNFSPRKLYANVYQLDSLLLAVLLALQDPPASVDPLDSQVVVALLALVVDRRTIRTSREFAISKTTTINYHVLSTATKATLPA